MARKPLTLQETVKQARALAQQSTDKLAAEQGLAAPPITPSGVGALGGTPQQQAMAGTPAAKKTALAAAATVTAAPSGETGLEQAMKTKPQAALDTAKLREMDRFSQSLGTFGDKVNQWIEGAVATAAATTTAALEFTAPTEEAITGAIAALPADKQQEAKNLMTLIKTQGSENNVAGMQQAVFQLNSLLGRNTTATLLESTGYGSLWRSVEETAAGQLEAGVQKTARGPDDKLTLQDITSLGTTTQEIAGLLNMTEDAVAQLTLGDFQSRLQTIGQTQFGATQQVSANIASALTSPAERQALTGIMREMEEAGIAGAEAQFQRLVSDIEQGATIDIGGKTYSVEEFLAEGTISKLAEAYYMGDKELVDRLTAEEPQLKQWLDNNRTGLLTLIAAGSGRAQELKTHNETEDKARQLVSNYPDIVSKLNLDKDPKFKPGYVLPVGEKVDWSQAGPALQGILSGMDASQQPTALANFADTLNYASKAGLPQEIDTLKNSDPNLFLDTELISTYKGNISKYIDNQATLKGNDPIAILNTALLNDVTKKDIEDILANDQFLISIGQEPSEWWSLTGKDGKLDLVDAQNIANASIRPPTLAGTQQRDTFGADSIEYSSTPKRASGPAGEFQARYGADGIVTADEILADFDAGTLDLNELTQMFEGMGRPGTKAKGPLASLRQAYLVALDRTKANAYDGLNYGVDGLPAGAADVANSIISAHSTGAPFDGGQFRTVKAVVEKAIQDITASKAKYKNDDLTWRMDQDLNNLTSLLSQLQTIPEPARYVPSAEEGTVAKIHSGISKAGGYIESVPGKLKATGKNIGL